MAPESWEVVVVGGGAAGLMAAYCAAQRGRRTLLLEKNRQPGLKILISGGGRCNLTTTREGKDLEGQFGTRRGRWLRHALRSFPPRALRRLVEDSGVRLQEEDLEKVFPVSGKARDVLGALQRRVSEAGVELRFEAPVETLAFDADLGTFLAQSAGSSLVAETVVLATGGLSYPRTGATGDGYPMAQHFGHRVTKTFPALAPLLCDGTWVHELQGLVVDAQLQLRGADQRKLLSRRRPTLFTHLGLSGPGPMDLAGDVEEGGPGCVVYVDLLPDQDRESTNQVLLRACAESGRRQVAQLLPGGLPERLRRCLLERVRFTGSGAELTKAVRHALVEALHRLPIPIAGTRGYAHAEVTRGGVELSEVDPKTCESKLQPGLFFCGEVLDVDGPIGGFNFQAAFATGFVAGSNA